MGRLALALLAVYLALLVRPDAHAAGPPYNFQAATDLLSASLDRYGNGGLVAVVEQGTNEIFRFEGTTGPALLQIRLDSTVAIASCSKWLSGAVVLALAERGVFHLDDAIGRHLPAFEAAGKGHITIRQCFAMTSGLSLRDPDYELDTNLTLAASVDLIAANTPILFPPGTQLDYEGDGMQVVGRICEVATGRDWRSLARDLVFAPLGMSTASYTVFGLNPAIAGGVRCSGADYLKFLRMIRNNGVGEAGNVVLSSRSVQEFFTNQSFGLPEHYSPWFPSLYFPYNQRPDYGMGSWVLAQQPGGGVVEEVASPGAFGTFPWVDRRRGLCGIFFMLAPQGFSTAGTIDLRVMDAIRTAIDQAGLPPGPSPGPLQPRRAGDHLIVEWPGGGTLETSTNLIHWSPLPWAASPFAESLLHPPAPALHYRVRW